MIATLFQTQAHDAFKRQIMGIHVDTASTVPLKTVYSTETNAYLFHESHVVFNPQE